jgi:hypothetical protein
MGPWADVRIIPRRVSSPGQRREHSPTAWARSHSWVRLSAVSKVRPLPAVASGGIWRAVRDAHHMQGGGAASLALGVAALKLGSGIRSSLTRR